MVRITLALLALLATQVVHAQAHVPKDLAPIVVATNSASSAPEPAPVVASAPASKAAVGESSGSKFVCRGVAPFWTLKLGNEQMEMEFGGQTTQYSKPVATASENAGHSVTNFSGSTPDGGSLQAVVVNILLNGGAPCDDGMSDQAYTHSAFLNRGGQILNGCCWVQP